MTASLEVPRAASVALPLSAASLRGELDVPPEPRGLVVLAHAAGGEPHAARLHEGAAYLRRAGFGVLLLDLFTEDEERGEAREADLVFDVPVLVQRLVESTQWLLGTVPGTYGRVAYFAVETAAAAALVAAVRLRDAVGAVVTASGRVDLAGVTAHWVQAPTLLLVGGRDEPGLLVNRAAVRTLRCARALEVVSGAESLLDERWTMRAATRSARDWLERHLPRLERRVPVSA